MTTTSSVSVLSAIPRLSHHLRIALPHVTFSDVKIGNSLFIILADAFAPRDASLNFAILQTRARPSMACSYVRQSTTEIARSITWPISELGCATTRSCARENLKLLNFNLIYTFFYRFG